MKFTLVHIMLVLLSFSTAFTQGWKLVSDEDSGVSVRMPQKPASVKENLLTANGVATKEVYAVVYKGVDLVFETQAILGDNKKANVEAINNALKLVAIQNQGTQRKKQSFKKNNFQYNYSETPLISGHLIRSIVFAYNKQLIHIYVKGNIQDVYGIDANFYLESWSIPSIAGVVDKKRKVKDKEDKKKKEKEEEIRKTDFDWEAVQFDEKIEIEFPGNPFKKQTFIARGKSDILISAYSYTSIQDRLVYVVTERKFSNDEGQLSDEALYSFMIERMIDNKKLKKPKEIDSKTGKQYIASKFFKSKRLKLVRVDNTMYQFLVIGKRKNIYSDEVEYFFNQTNTLQ